ncbi:MAG: TlpA family protein disulfide reductase, partial [Bryobacteraceae bacterium]
PDQEQEAVKFLKEAGVSGPAYIRKAKDEDKFIRMVDPNWSGALPALILYDRAGKRVRSIMGEHPPKVIEAEIVKVLGQP